MIFNSQAFKPPSSAAESLNITASTSVEDTREDRIKNELRSELGPSALPTAQKVVTTSEGSTAVTQTAGTVQGPTDVETADDR